MNPELAPNDVIITSIMTATQSCYPPPPPPASQPANIAPGPRDSVHSCKIHAQLLVKIFLCKYCAFINHEHEHPQAQGPVERTNTRWPDRGAQINRHIKHRAGYGARHTPSNNKLRNRSRPRRLCVCVSVCVCPTKRERCNQICSPNSCRRARQRQRRPAFMYRASNVCIHLCIHMDCHMYYL